MYSDWGDDDRLTFWDGFVDWMKSWYRKVRRHFMKAAVRRRIAARRNPHWRN